MNGGQQNSGTENVLFCQIYITLHWTQMADVLQRHPIATPLSDAREISLDKLFVDSDFL